MVNRNRWSAPSPPVRVGLLVACGVLLTGAALWAGANGPWTGRPQSTRPLPTLDITPPTITRPPLPTLPPVLASSGGGSSSGPTIVLLVLGGVLMIALLVMLSSMVRGRSGPSDSRKRKQSELDEVIPEPSRPDPERPFDTREAADYVIACWEQVEQHAAGRGLGRRPEHTPTEFLDHLRAAYPVDAGACAELLALYQRARFDHVRLLPDTANRARVCADVVLSAIRTAGALP